MTGVVRDGFATERLHDVISNDTATAAPRASVIRKGVKGRTARFIYFFGMAASICFASLATWESGAMVSTCWKSARASVVFFS